MGGGVLGTKVDGKVAEGSFLAGSGFSEDLVWGLVVELLYGECGGCDGALGGLCGETTAEVWNSRAEGGASRTECGSEECAGHRAWYVVCGVAAATTTSRRNLNFNLALLE